MKFFIPFVAAFAASAVAAPAAANTVSIQKWVHELTSQAKVHTGAMNKTIAALPANANDAQKKKAAASVIVEIHALTNLLHLANVKVNEAPTQVTRDVAAKRPTLGDLPKDILGQLDGRPIVLAHLLLPLLRELDPALQSVLSTLSLQEVYVAIQPLIKVELPALIVGLSNLVTGLLAALSPLLAGVGSLLGPLLIGLGL